jgi:hypothetical protein
MTVRRGAVIAEYEEEIGILYNMVDESTTLNIPPLVNWRADSVRNFVRAAILSVLNARVGDEDDIFQHGCDSLQATWIRNALLRILHEHTKLDTRRDTRNFVYDYPTVARLGEYIFNLGNISEMERVEKTESTETKISAMRAMASKYTENLPKTRLRPTVNRQDTPARGHAMVVLVTGTTGALGCYLLARLLQDPRIERIYSFNRHAGDFHTRQNLAFIDRGLDPGTLGSKKLSLLEGDLTKPNLGVSGEAYEEVRSLRNNIF